MMLSKSLLLLAIANFASSSPVSRDQSLVGRAITGTKYIFSFGDSYSQTGFDPTLTAPSSSNPLGNPAFPGYTTTNGPNWLGYLIETYNTSLTLDINLSFGGATVNATLVAPYATTVLSMIDQVKQFSTYYASKPASVPWTSANTLFAVWLGVNDVGNSWSSSGESTTIGLILDDYFAQCQIMYNAGARYFLFLTVPPIQRSPLVLANSVSDQNAEASVIASFNSVLATKAAAFKTKNSGITSWIVDTQAPFNTALNNPTAYGAADATCFNADGVSCLWWNNYHPGQAIHKLVAQAVVSALSGTFFGSGSATTSTSKPATSTTSVVSSTSKASTTTTSKASSTTTTKTSATAPATTGAAHWSQCGGQGWTGPTSCASPYVCTFSNAYYSQCL